MADDTKILQLKIHLKHISPMIWRRVLVPSSSTLRELHGIIQVAMGWEGYHLYLFHIHAVDYGPIELCVSNPDLPLHDFGFRKNSRFSYIYDMGDYWEHDVRVEDVLDADAKGKYPICTGGARRCPDEDCGGVERYRYRMEDAISYDAACDVDVMMEFANDLLKHPDATLKDFDLDEVKEAAARMKVRTPYLEDKFSRKQVNDLFKKGRHQELMVQNTEVVLEFDI